MPRIVETLVYALDELPPPAQDRARAWYREIGFDHDWYDAVYDDFQQIAAILGLRFRTTPVRLYGGGTRQVPCIWFRGFWSQGDGAAYEAWYTYAPRAAQVIRTQPRKMPSCTALPRRCSWCRGATSTSCAPRPACAVITATQGQW